MNHATEYDAIVVGSGPNGLSAAITIAEKNKKVLLIEAAETIGGGMRTTELIDTGFKHDVCSSVYPLVPPSPFFKNLLDKIDVELIKPDIAIAHVYSSEEAVPVYEDLKKTSTALGIDGTHYERLISPLLKNDFGLFDDILSPFTHVRNPLTMMRFGWHGTQSSYRLAKNYFQLESTRGMFAGMAGHSILPLDQWLTAGVGIMFCVSAHSNGWPIVRGGAGALTTALANYFQSLGGEIQTGNEVRSLDQLPDASAVVFDTSAESMARIAGDQLPAGYHRKLAQLRHGPGICKVDWTLHGPIPWNSEFCQQAGTVHLAGGFDEVATHEKAVCNGTMTETPFVLVTQPSVFDPSRAPNGKHIGWAYCHVPHACDEDYSNLIENRIEQYAPGFKDQIIDRHVLTTGQLEQYNANYIGGDISCGAMDRKQALFRPTFRLDPYSTPNPKIFLCSAATPPGPGVHGMCGYYAARSALRKRLR